ncbi:glycoside hydrolase family 20 zincin-like fold domain-containing protein [Mycoplasma sp. AC1221]
MKQYKKLKHLILGASSIGVIAVSVTTTTAQNQDTTSARHYDIAPEVQSITYLNKTSLISRDVNLVYESNIDQATKNRLKAALAFRNITSSESRNIAEGKTNILVGIQGDSDTLVDDQIKKIDSSNDFNASNFAKNDSYVIKTQDNYIELLAKDSDAAYFGATTLWHIFQQLDGYKIEDFTINDYADIKMRGMMDSWKLYSYAPTQSKQDIINLMNFASFYKLNTYIWNPDQKILGENKSNRNQIDSKPGWSVLYTPEELKDLKDITEASKQSHVHFVYTLDALGDFNAKNSSQTYTDAEYQKDLGLLKEKLLQVIRDGGVRYIGMLSPGEDSTKVSQLFNDLVTWLKQLQATYPDLSTQILFEGKYGQGGSDFTDTNHTSLNTGYLPYYANLPHEVIPFLINDASKRYIDAFTVDRYSSTSYNIKPVFHKTFSVDLADNSWLQNTILTRGAEDLIKLSNNNSDNVNPDKFSGLVLTDVNIHPQFSLFSYYDLANISWKILPTHSNSRNEAKKKLYYDSFKVVASNTLLDTPASIALRHVAKYLSVEYTGQINVFGDDPLKEAATNFSKLDLYKGNHSTEANAYLEQLDNIISEIQLLQDNKDNSLFLANIKDNYLSAVKDMFSAYKYYVLAYLENQKVAPVLDRVVNLYNIGQTYLQNFATYKYGDPKYGQVIIKNLNVGADVMKNLQSYLQDIVSKYLDKVQPVGDDGSDNQPSVITSMSDPSNASLSDIFILGNQRQLVYKNNGRGPNKIKTGDWFGVSFKKPIHAKDLQVKFGSNNSNHNEYFKSFKVQYKLYGQSTWNDLQKDATTQDLQTSGSTSNDYTLNSGALTTTTNINKWNISVNKDNVSAIRIVDTEPANTQRNAWFRIYEFVVNTDSAPRIGKISDNLPISEDNDNHNSADSSNKQTFNSQNITNVQKSIFDLSTNINNFANNKYIQFKLTNESEVTSVVIEQGNSKLNSGVVEYWDSHASSTSNNDASTTGTWKLFGNIRSGAYQIIRGQAHAQFFRIRSTDTSLTGTWNLVSLHLFGPSNQFLYTDKDDSNKTNLFTTKLNNNEFNLFVATPNSTTASYSQTQTTQITLNDDKYVGLDLLRMYELTNIKFNGNATLDNKVVLETSRNGIEWTQYTGTLDDTNKFARYIRVKRATNQTPSFSNLDVSVQKPKSFGTLLGSNVQIINGWGNDTRYSDSALDGDYTTSDNFKGWPKANDYILYDLGKPTTLQSLKLYVDPNTSDYPRFFKIYVSETNSNETNNWDEIFYSRNKQATSDSSTTVTGPTTLAAVKDFQYLFDNTLSDQRLNYMVKVDPQRNNFTYFEADASKIAALNNKNIRYVKIVFTKDINDLLQGTSHNKNRGVTINEIVVNDKWDNVPHSDARFSGTNYEPTLKINSPKYFVDGDYYTYWTPAQNNGNLKFYINPQTYNDKDVNVFSDGSAQDATFNAIWYNTTTNKEEITKLGTLNLEALSFSLKNSDNTKKLVGFQINWTDKKPLIYEISPSPRETQDSGDQTNKPTLATLKESLATTPTGYNDWTQDSKTRFDKIKTSIDAMAAENVALTDRSLHQLKVAVDAAKAGTPAVSTANVATLNNIINTAYSNQSYIQDANYAKYQFLLDQVKQMATNPSKYSNDDFNELKSQLDAAKQGLKYSTYNQQVAEFNLKELDNLNANHYDPQTYAQLQETKKALEAKIKDGTATIDDFVKLNAQVATKVEELKPNDLGTTYTNLADAITKAKAFIAENALKFPQQSQQLQKQIDQWQATLNNKDAKLEDLQKALNRMNRANEDAQTQKDELVASLDNLLTPLANTDEIYTNDSYQAYLDTINQIKTINHDPSMLTASDIQKYVKQIQDAQNMLAISPTKLETAKKQAIALTEGLDSDVQQEFKNQLAKANDTAALAKIINAINDKVQQSKKNKEVLSNSIKRLLDKLTNEKLKADLEQEVKEAKTENELANFKSKVLQLLSPKPTLPTQPDTPENGDKDTQKPEQGGSTNNPSNTEGSKPQEGGNSGSTTTPPTSENKPKDQNPQDNKNAQTSKTVEKSTGPTGGAIAGIVIAVLAFVLGIATFGYTWFKNKKKKSNQ